MLFWIRGKRVEDSEVVVVVQSRRLKVKIKRVVRFGKEWSEYEREKGSGHEASARHLTITNWSGSGRKSRDSDSTDMLPLHWIRIFLPTSSGMPSSWLPMHVAKMHQPSTSDLSLTKIGWPPRLRS